MSTLGFHPARDETLAQTPSIYGLSRVASENWPNKVGQALEAVAAADAVVDAVSGDGAGGGGSPSSATTTTTVPKAATLALEIAGKDSAKLTVKEVKPLGSVDLAAVTLPVVDEVREWLAVVTPHGPRCTTGQRRQASLSGSKS